MQGQVWLLATRFSLITPRVPSCFQLCVTVAVGDAESTSDGTFADVQSMAC